MKLKQVSQENIEGYPQRREITSMKGVKTLLIGASITASMVLVGCASKKEEPKGESPTLPAVAPSTKDNHNSKNPDIPKENNAHNSNKKNDHGTMLIRKRGRVAAPRGYNADKDNDGIADSIDKCPTVKGPASNNGCPIPRPHLRGKPVAPRRP
jgi:hypothetical protein